jgi:two-component system response regulator PilR (NtrC family)
VSLVSVGRLVTRLSSPDEAARSDLLTIEMSATAMSLVLAWSGGDLEASCYAEGAALESYRLLAVLASAALRGRLVGAAEAGADEGSEPSAAMPPLRPVGGNAREGLSYTYQQIVGNSPRLLEVLRIVDRATELSAPVLIQGETGTGKEAIAQAIHNNGPRRRARLVTINAAALSQNLLESELFGYMKGAFTGADRDKKGLFEVASGGTLFLDEIGEMPLEMQMKLLRVLQEREVLPLGAHEVVKVDARLLVATNRDLREEVEKGNFREDLYYRLTVLPVSLPTLRDRREDISDLIEHFLAVIGRQRGEPPRVLDRRNPVVLQKLVDYQWPGNIRQLQNVIINMVSLAGDERVLGYRMLPDEIRGEKPGLEAPRPVRPLEGVVDEVERAEIVNALRVTGGNRVRAAELLEVNRRTLLRRLDKYGLSRNKRRQDGDDDSPRNL